LSLQNIVLVGSTEDKPINRGEVSRVIDMAISQKHARVLSREDLSHGKDGVLLTDNFAPVENLMLPAVEDYFKDYFGFYKTFLGEKFFL
jgi:hypothetical protein